MRFRWKTILLLATLGGCSWFSNDQTFSVYFRSYSAEADQQANQTIHNAARFAETHPLLRVGVVGYSAPLDPKQDADGLSGRRAEMVKQLLISNGVRPGRITTVANGVTDPSPMPDLAVRRVDISFERPQPGDTAATGPDVR